MQWPCEGEAKEPSSGVVEVGLDDNCSKPPELTIKDPGEPPTQPPLMGSASKDPAPEVEEVNFDNNLSEMLTPDEARCQEIE